MRIEDRVCAIGELERDSAQKRQRRKRKCGLRIDSKENINKLVSWEIYNTIRKLKLKDLVEICKYIYKYGEQLGKIMNYRGKV